MKNKIYNSTLNDYSPNNSKMYQKMMGIRSRKEKALSINKKPNIYRDNKKRQKSELTKVKYKRNVSSPRKPVVKPRNYGKMKIHRGPMNLDAITMKNPEKLFEDIISILKEIGVKIDKSSNYNLKCKHQGLKFMIEINLLEMFPNVYVVKFYKNNVETSKYFKLCNKIFSKITFSD